MASGGGETRFEALLVKKPEKTTLYSLTNKGIIILPSLYYKEHHLSNGQHYGTPITH